MNNNLFHNVLKDISRNRIVSKTKDKSGNVDVNKALSIARAKGYNSFIDRARIKNVHKWNQRRNKHRSKSMLIF